MKDGKLIDMKFSDYYKTYKEKLLEDTDSVLEFSTTHVLTKYCKMPLIEDNNKYYHSFKVNDEIIILWERKNGEITPISFNINETTLTSQWNKKKTKKWVLSSTKQIVS